MKRTRSFVRHLPAAREPRLSFGACALPVWIVGLAPAGCIPRFDAECIRHSECPPPSRCIEGTCRSEPGARDAGTGSGSTEHDGETREDGSSAETGPDADDNGDGARPRDGGLDGAGVDAFAADGAQSASDAAIDAGTDTATFSYAPLNFLPEPARATHDLLVSANCLVDTETGSFSGSGCGDFPLGAGIVRTASTAATPGVLVAHVGTLRIEPGGSLIVRGRRALIIAAYDRAIVIGRLDVSATGTIAGAGGDHGRCTGLGATGSAGRQGEGGSGGGGGAFGGLGGAGGLGEIEGGLPGWGFPSTLAPLLGGCPGGRGGDSQSYPTMGGAGGGGGGAVQISSASELRIAGTIAAGGGGGIGGDGLSAAGGGGGSGGGVLLEARDLVLETSARVIANGGGGGGGTEDGTGGNGGGGDDPQGGTGGVAESIYGGDGGRGGGLTATGTARPDGRDGRPGDDVRRAGGGGGGGSVGRIVFHPIAACALNGATVSPLAVDTSTVACP